MFARKQMQWMWAIQRHEFRCINIVLWKQLPRMLLIVCIYKNLHSFHFSAGTIQRNFIQLSTLLDLFITFICKCLWSFQTIVIHVVKALLFIEQTKVQLQDKFLNQCTFKAAYWLEPFLSTTFVRAELVKSVPSFNAQNNNNIM